MESALPHPSLVRTILSSYISNGLSFDQLFWFYRQHHLSDITTRRRSATGIQWTQTCTFLKFQSLVISIGLIANLFGPMEGGRHDAGMLNESGLLNALQAYAHSPTGHPLCIYGDPAYPLRPQLMCPYRPGDYAGPLTPQMRAFNAAMSSVRISVE